MGWFFQSLPITAAALLGGSVSVDVTGQELTASVGTVDAVSVTPDAWSALEKTSGVYLSGGDRTAYAATAGEFVRSTRKNPQTGKFYAEFFITDVDVVLGIVSVSESLTTDIHTVGAVVYCPASYVYIEESLVATIDTIYPGDLLRMAVDFDAQKIWFAVNFSYWNSHSEGDPATGAYGLDCALAAGDIALAFQSYGVDAQASVSAEVADLFFSPPVGFKSWMGEDPPLADQEIGVSVGFVVAGSPTADAWSNLDVGPNTTLSDSDKTATTSSTYNNLVRSSKKYPQTGKYYAEFLMTVMNNTMVGNLQEDFPNNDGVTQLFTDGTCVYNGTVIYCENSYQASLSPAATDGDTICAAFDFDAQEVWYRVNDGDWNADSGADPGAGTGGIGYTPPAGKIALAFQSFVSGAEVTVRTEAAEYVYTPPDGFLSWMGESMTPTPDAWSMDDKMANATLSNFDKTVTATSYTDNTVWSTQRQPQTGKFYAEFLMDETSGAYVGNVTTTIGISMNVYITGACVSDGGYIFIEGGYYGDVTPAADGDTICVAFDFDAQMVWFRTNSTYWNSSIPGGADPAAGVGGFPYTPPAGDTALAFMSSSSGGQATVRTRFTDFVYGRPPGFMSWMGEVPGPEAAGQQVAVSVGTVAAGAPIPDAWSVLEKTADVVLSNGDKTATATGFTQGYVRSTRRNAQSGKFYAEMVLENSLFVAIGNILSANPLTDDPLGDGAGVYPNTTNIWIMGAPVGNITTAVAGDTICMAFDFDNDKVWFRTNNDDWNNDVVANPATNTNGLTYTPSAGDTALVFNGFSTDAEVTLHADHPTFTYAVPSGFKSWLGKDPPTLVNITGQAVTVSVGTVTVVGKANVDVTGQAATAAVGTVTVVGKASHTVSGQQIAVSVGDVIVRLPVSVNVSGQQVTVSVGTIAEVRTSVSHTVSGQQMTTAVGTIPTVTGKARVDLAANGQQIAVSVGTIANVIGKASVSLAGSGQAVAVNTIFRGLTSGAVAGIIGSGGALPTGWTYVKTANITLTVVSTQIDDGIECFDLKIDCTTAATSTVSIFYPNGFGGMVAALGEVWTTGAYLKRMALSGAGIDGFALSVHEATAGGGYLFGHDNYTGIPSAGVFQASYREVTAKLAQPTVARTDGGLYISQNATAAPSSVTIRIAASLTKGYLFARATTGVGASVGGQQIAVETAAPGGVTIENSQRIFVTGFELTVNQGAVFVSIPDTRLKPDREGMMLIMNRWMGN